MNSFTSLQRTTTTKTSLLHRSFLQRSSPCQVKVLFRSSTPKTPLQTTTHPKSSSSSSLFISMRSSSTPRCSTPVYSKQRRTRPFLICELCRQRALQTSNVQRPPQQQHQQQPQKIAHPKPKAKKEKSLRSFSQTRSTIDQLLVWIV